LHLASQNDHAHVVRLLCVHGADVFAVTHVGTTPLFLSAQQGSIHVARILISYGASADTARVEDGSTPLHVAALNGHNKLANLLLANGAWVDAPNKNGETALFTAASTNRLETAETLLRNGASPSAKTNSGETPLKAARRCRGSNASKLVNLLRHPPVPASEDERVSLVVHPSHDRRPPHSSRVPSDRRAATFAAQEA
jgi:ankyrin repeat protein